MTRCSGSRFLFLIPLVLLLVLFTVRDAAAHGGRFIIPTAKGPGDESSGENASSPGTDRRVLVFPGSGPQIPFKEESWEFWWFFNSAPLVQLKPALFRLTPQAGYIDYPYEKVPAKDRVMLVRFLVRLYMAEQDAAIREAVVLSLGRVRDASSLSYLKIAYQDDPDLYVRTMAVVAMGISRIPGVVDALQSVFEDEKEYTEIRIYAAVSAGLAGGEGARKFFKKWLAPKAFKGLPDRRLQEAVAFGVGLTEDDALAPLVRSALHDRLSPQRVVNAYLILSLGRLRDRAANAILLAYLDDRNTQLRRSAAIALGAAASPSDKDVVEALVKKTTQDPDSMVRKFAYIALGRIGGERAEAYLYENIPTAKLSDLPYVSLGLGLSRNPKYGGRVLARYGAVKNISVRAALAVTLGLLGYKPALGELRKTLDGGGAPDFLGYHALALGLLKDGDSVERIKKLYRKANDLELLRFAAIALGLIGDRTFTREAAALLDRSTPEMVRLATVYNLGLIGDRKDMEMLKQLAEDETENSRIRSYAVLSLGHLLDEAPVPAMSKITSENNYTILDNYMYELFNVN